MDELKEMAIVKLLSLLRPEASYLEDLAAIKVGGP